MVDELVHRTVTNGIATITLDSPHNRNALSRQLRRELREHLTAARADSTVRVIVLDHIGPVFCAGMDLKESRSAGAEDQGVREFPEILEQIWTSPVPVVAKISGPARAGGIGLIAACDIAISAETATFAFSEVRIGVVPAVISVTVLPRLHPRQAHELFLTGETFDARRAAAIGLLSSVVAADELDTETDRYTGMLALGGPEALAATKDLLRAPKSGSMAEDFAAMLELSARHFSSAEGREGIQSFAEKRRPSWVP
jgi:methylglutaconyl-CoA hydratase